MTDDLKATLKPAPKNIRTKSDVLQRLHHASWPT